MRKIPLLLLITLIFGLVFTPKVNAAYIDADENTWYTVAELLEYKKEVDPEIDEACGNNRSCIEDYHKARVEIDDKYRALFILEIRYFVISELNPGAETIKIVVFDQNANAKKRGYGEIIDLTVKDVYVGWFNSQNDESIFSRNFRGNPEPYYNNTVAGAHRIFSRSIDMDGPNWLPAYNEEIEFAMGSGSDILNNKSGGLGYKASAVQYLNTSTSTGYSDCLKSENYDENTGCRALVSTKKGVEYFAIGTPETTNDETDGDQDSSGNQSDSEQDPTNEMLNEGQDSSEEQDNDSDITGADNIAIEPKATAGSIISAMPKTAINTPVKEQVNILPKTPETGTNTNLCSQKTIEFPWWLVIVIALGDAVILWLFWPKIRKSHKKS